MKPLWIRNPRAILADNAGGGLVVADGKITELVPAGGRPAGHDRACHEVFDASEHVVIPGLINTHHHFYQTLTRALRPALNKALFPWLKTLYPVWAGLDEEMIGLSTRLALAELLLSGCTTAADHHYLFNDALANAIDIQVGAVGEMGMRAMLSRGSMSLSVEDGGLPPKSVVQSGEVILDDCARVVAAYHQPGAGAMIRIAFAPCSPFSVTGELMKATATLAGEMDVRLHTHLAETEDETAFCLRLFGLRPLDYIEQVGWLTGRTWLAHGIHFDDGEIGRLGAAGTGISHCPGSNMVLASGICPGLDLAAAGAPVGLGVDGSASNDHSNLMQEVRQAMLVQKLRYGADRMSHLDALEWATRGSARCLGWDDIGEIAIGKQADLALFRLDAPRFSGADDPLGALVLCGAHTADAVMVAGKWRVRNAQIEGLDLGQLIADHAAAARRLRQKMT